MIDWQVVSKERAQKEWDAQLLTLGNNNPSQSWSWGSHKENLGQKVIRLAVYDNGQAKTMAQCFIRRYPLNHAMIWVPGGPVGDLELCDARWFEKLREAAGTRRFVCRIRPYRPYAAQDALRLQSQGWRRALRPLDSGWTVLASLRGDESALSSNWRHNLKRAQTRGSRIRRWENPSAEDLLSILKEVETFKNIPKQYVHNLEEISSLLEHFKKELLIWRCDNEAGSPIAMRACLILGRRAYDMLAATNPEGRKLYGSYAVLWALLNESRARGATEYDMGGVDPQEPGVLNFKRGLGPCVEFAGEWEWASSEWLRWGANFLISQRLKKQGHEPH